MLRQIVNQGAFTKYSQDVINENFGLLAGSFGGGVFGQSFYVDAANGTDTNPGTAELPVASINRAIGLCVSGRGDSIFVAAGEYDEDVVMSKDYVALIGGQNGGYAKPDIGPATAAGPAIVVSGQGCILEHIRAFADLGDCIRQQGNGFIISGCTIDGDLTASKAGIRLLPSSTNTHLTASEGLIANNYIRGSAIGICFDTGAAPVGVGSTDNVITSNIFTANTLDLATADAGAALYSVQVTTIGPGNQFIDKNKAVYIDLTTTNGGAASAQTGTITGNSFASDTMTTTKVKMVGTGFTFMGNIDTVGVVDGSGLD